MVDSWFRFLHVAAVMAFMLVHGVHIFVIWKQRAEPDPARNLALFEALPSVAAIRAVAGAVVVTGLLLVASLSLWAMWWIWLSIGTLGAVWLLMFRFGAAYYIVIEDAANRAIEAKGTPGESAALANFTKARHSRHALGISAVGFGGLAAILWLMIFKPF